MARPLVRGALQRRNFCKSCLPTLSAARRPVVFSLSQPCFNCRFIFRQTGCLHLRLSASQALREKRGSAAPPRRQGGGLFQEASQRSDSRCSPWESIKKGQEAGGSETRSPTLPRPLQLTPHRFSARVPIQRGPNHGGQVGDLGQRSSHFSAPHITWGSYKKQFASTGLN